MATNKQIMKDFIKQVSDEFNNTTLSHEDFVKYVKKEYDVGVMVEYREKVKKYGLTFNLPDLRRICGENVSSLSKMAGKKVNNKMKSFWDKVMKLISSGS